MKKLLLSSIVAIAAAWTNIAAADGWPTSVVGTWSIIGNHHAGLLRIDSIAAVGLCRRIIGVIYPGTAVVGNIEGFYCPYSGRIQFVRKSPATNDAYQVWTGNVSQDAAIDRLGGTFTSVSAALGGSLGEYNFQGQK